MHVVDRIGHVAARRKGRVESCVEGKKVGREESVHLVREW